MGFLGFLPVWAQARIIYNLTSMDYLGIQALWAQPGILYILTSITEVSRGMSFSENQSSVPNLVNTDENQWMLFFLNLLAVPKPASHRQKPWM